MICQVHIIFSHSILLCKTAPLFSWLLKSFISFFDFTAVFTILWLFWDTKDSNPNNKTLGVLLEMPPPPPPIHIIFSCILIVSSGIKLSIKWRQMIPFKIHHHAIDYLYCNIKCCLVNLTDSLKIMECNRYLYSTGKKKSIENIRRGVF